MASYDGSANWTAQQDTTDPWHDAAPAPGVQTSLRDSLYRPAGALAETFPRTLMGGTAYAPPVGQLLMVSIPIEQGVTIGHLTFVNGSVGATAPTHYWFGLFDLNRNLLAVTDDQLTAAWAGNTTKTLAVTKTAAGAASSFQTPYQGLYYLGAMIASTTNPNIVAGATSGSANFNSMPPILVGLSNSGMTTPPAFPFQANALSPINQLPYGYVAA